MNLTLSIVLPVCDAEQYLAAQVNELLETLPEVAERFEVVVVDDGSSDDTAHIADELATCFPQVRVITHPFHLGLAEAVQTGLDNARYETVLVRSRGAKEHQPATPPKHQGRRRHTITELAEIHGTARRIDRLTGPRRPNLLGKIKQFAFDE